MFWYRVSEDRDYQDFDTFAEAKTYYDSRMQERWQEYKDMNILEDWEEDKQYFDLYLEKIEQIILPTDQIFLKTYCPVACQACGAI